jgi:Cdc6-like AAA superfamily ATPase
MYLEIKTKNEYGITNDEFKQCTQPLLDYVLNPNKIVFDYIKSSPENFKNQRHQILDPRIRDTLNIFTSDETNTESGVFEECLKTHIISQDYSILILTGASGSGKTSIINYVRGQIDECTNEEACIRFQMCNRKKKEILYYDFLDTNTTESSQKILDNYEFKLNAYLNLAVETCFKHEKVLEIFLNFCSTTREANLFQLKLILSPLKYDWTVEDVLVKIKQHGLSDSNQNRILISMLSYFRKQYPDHHKGCFTLIYDNIDKLDDEEQTEIIKNIISLHNSINCKLIITSRLTTFYKLNDNFSNTYNVIENAGPKPVDILYHRIKYYLDNRNTLQDIIDVRNRVLLVDKTNEGHKKYLNYLDCFDNILMTLLKYISPINNDSGIQNEESQRINFNKGQIQKTLSAFSGLSVRRGLELSKRFVDSYVYNYYDEPTPNQLIASLSFRCSRGLKFSDLLITNIYGRYDDNRKNSWLLYKILNILKVSQENRIPLSTRQLCDILNLYDKIGEDDIISAINVLINSNKRLAYVSGFSRIETIDKETDKTQKIHITNCGKEYLSFLSIDLTYVQNSFAALDWKTITYYIDEEEINRMFSGLDNRHLHKSEADWLLDSLKEHFNITYVDTKPKVFNISDIFERMLFIRNGLEILLYHDIFESYYFNKNKGARNYISNIVSFMHYAEEINSFPSLRLTLALTDSFIKILKSYHRNGANLSQNIDEIRQWQSFLLKVDLWHKLLFKISISHSETLYTDIEEFVGIIEMQTH